MRRLPALAHLALASSCFLLAVACATSPGVEARLVEGRTSPQVAESQGLEGGASASPSPWRSSGGGRAHARLLPVGTRELPDDRFQILLPPLPPHPALERLSVEEIRPLLASFTPLHPPLGPRLRLLESSGLAGLGAGPTTPAEARLREEFLSQFGSPLLSLPESLTSSRFFHALQLSPRYMGEGVREAALELFRSPAFVMGVCLSIIAYFSAWLAPEPLFTKALAATMTLRLSLLVGLAELGQVAQACIRLYQEAEAARTPQELEAAAARFGLAMGGTGLRVMVVVVSMGLGRLLPHVPEGGIWTLLPSPRAVAGGEAALGVVRTAQVVADGTLVVTGAAAGAEVASMMSGPGGASGGARLSTRYGPPHTRKNPPHNEAIEQELAARERAGHGELLKNKAQWNAEKQRVFEQSPGKGPRFRRPDASSLRPDGVRHNTNYVSNPKNLKDELDAFDAMVRADQYAIHELYLLNGKLLRRHVPPGVKFP
jgi:hypothetical protein